MKVSSIIFLMLGIVLVSGFFTAFLVAFYNLPFLFQEVAILTTSGIAIGVITLKLFGNKRIGPQKEIKKWGQ
ncbi:MAG: hypothetical protein WC666_03105 [Candidatus Paceibacterota bacterium]